MISWLSACVRLPDSCLVQDKTEAKSVQVLMLRSVTLMCIHIIMAVSSVALLQLLGDCVLLGSASNEHSYA